MNAQQLDLDQYRTELGRTATSTGLRSAQVGDPDGFTIACESIQEWAASGREFTADNITDVGSNAKGAAFAHMRRAGIIVCLGFTTSKSVPRHGGVCRIWRGGP
jgi:hypothetical protein